MLRRPPHIARCAAPALLALAAAAAIGATPLPESAAPPAGYLAWLADLSRDAASPGDTVLQATAQAFLPPAPEGSRLEASRKVRARELGVPGSDGEVAPAVLGAATDYQRLGEYERATDLYLEAARLDTALAAAAQAGEAALATAIAGGDSAWVQHRLLNLIGASDPTGQADEIVVAYRWCLARADREHLDLLNRKVEGLGEAAPATLRYWRAFALAALQAWPEALAALTALTADAQAPLALDRAQRLWVAVAVPDLLVLAGRDAAAAEGYRALAASEAPALRPWALYQMANLDFLAGRYAGARASFQAVCALPAGPAWQARACALAALTDSLGRVLGRRMGADEAAAPVAVAGGGAHGAR